MTTITLALIIGLAAAWVLFVAAVEALETTGTEGR